MARKSGKFAQHGITSTSVRFTHFKIASKARICSSRYDGVNACIRCPGRNLQLLFSDHNAVQELEGKFMRYFRDDFWITDDPAEVSLPAVHGLLAETYWAESRPFDRTEKSLNHSVLFSLYHKADQIGFGRVLTDYGIYAIVLDVVVAQEYRGQGLGKWLLSTIISHPVIKNLRIVLWTTDQTEFYQACGLTYEESFKILGKSGVWNVEACAPTDRSGKI